MPSIRSMPVVRADATRLQEILYNLLDNALKYSREGGKFRLEAQSPRTSEVGNQRQRHRNRDPGGGFAPQFSSAFIAPTRRAAVKWAAPVWVCRSSSTSRKCTADSVEAESTFGHGTTIRVILPTADPHPKRPLSHKRNIN